MGKGDKLYFMGSKDCIITCETCSKIFDSVYAMKLHMKVVHNRDYCANRDPVYTVNSVASNKSLGGPSKHKIQSNITTTHSNN